ncbi:DUF1765-domain-containing protein [Patellaria atrata CBS 101060]|uniref:DUF1765-domain-containing protein n=1 Tax=Patellaria atrata CBS 101060 TaxID=1346257 RepID=A0A9P4VWX5_9PEZI|nr:DUF1765-domain-containing protein [Patellaria atrata CBS 101060]
MPSLSLVRNQTEGLTKYECTTERTPLEYGHTTNEPQPPDAVYLPRAAGYTYFPSPKSSLFEDHTVLELKGTISEDDLTTSTSDTESYTSSAGTTPLTEPNSLNEDFHFEFGETDPAVTMLRLMRLNKKDSQETTSPNQNVEGNSSEARSRKVTKTTSPVRRSLSNFRRKSWLGTSRSPSPPKPMQKEPIKTETETPSDVAPGVARRMSFALRRRSSSHGPSQNRKRDMSNGGDTTKLDVKPKRPSSVFLKDPGSNPTSLQDEKLPAVPSLPKSFSSDRLRRLPTAQSVKDHKPLVPTSLSSDKLKSLKTDLSKKRDDLWTVFRNLDSEYHKFQNKTTIALKASIVRTALLPFLKGYRVHPSNKQLRPEDLDRRINILNRWWTGLLDMLHGKNNQSLTGTDRPAVLDAIIGIMERLEWRHAPSPFSPLSERSKSQSIPSSISSTSVSSSSSDFLIESVHHNVRNTFIQNLLGQMAFVIEKMSLRTTPASVVAFCGKTCAYAFFFCPGVAEILVRLWNPSMNTMRRITEEAGLARNAKPSTTHPNILPAFPSHLHRLRFGSLLQLSRELRKPSQLPLGTNDFDWRGPWVKRWCGRETDLFYVFVKHYHILAMEFLPEDASKIERLCVPGLVIVHAQILENLDATIHRSTTSSQRPEEPTQGPATITFDDVLTDPDTSASALAVLPANAIRLMAENRIIMSIRDYLSGRGSKYLLGRHVFAQAFSDIMKACAKNTSIYDFNACSLLCDFLEEALVILVRYEFTLTTEQPVLDWPFWLSVFQRLAESENTLTEIRLYSFLYSNWPMLIQDPTRRSSLCLDFLLDPQFFQSRFNHWCPMVRAYYMRLLCWRVARLDGDGSSVELEILQRLASQLSVVWSHYLFLMQEAQSDQKGFPSSIPCPPAPNRRLLIIRTDGIPSPNNNVFFSDSMDSSQKNLMTSSEVSLDSRPWSSHSDSSDSSDVPTDTKSKKWNILRALIGPIKPAVKSPSSSPGSSPPPKQAQTQRDSTPTNTVKSASSTGANGSSVQQTPISQPPSYNSYCFKFSLESVERRHQPHSNMRLFPPRLPMAAQLFLQSQVPISLPSYKTKPARSAAQSGTYAGRALAEWTLVVNESHNFFNRRKIEGVPNNKLVETPSLGVETFKRLS